MGARGPVPNREENLARPRSRKGSDEQPVTKGTMKPSHVPAPNEEWHTVARMVWDSMPQSGQSDFYQQSDWAFAYFVCEELTAYLSGERYNPKTGEMYVYRSPEMLKGLLSAMNNLLLTEADRRRVRIELTEPEKKDDATLIVLQGYRDALEQGPISEPTEAPDAE